jgi:hypothetical protein
LLRGREWKALIEWQAEPKLSSLNNNRICLLERFLRTPGANPTIVSYNASVVKIYSATYSMARLNNTNFFSDIKTL